MTIFVAEPPPPEEKSNTVDTRTPVQFVPTGYQTAGHVTYPP